MKEEIFNDNEDDSEFTYKSQSIYEKKKKIFSSLFPYDSNSYKFIYENNIDLNQVKEHTDYIYETIDKINNNISSDDIKLPIKYSIIKYLLYIGSFIIILLFLYFSFLFAAICLFNPMIVIMILFFGVTKIISFISDLYFKFQDSIIAKKINMILNEENKKNINKKPYIIWKYGRDGSWIEIKISNEKEK